MHYVLTQVAPSGKSLFHHGRCFLGHDLLLISSCRPRGDFVRVPLRHREKGQEVDCTESGEHPVVFVQARVVDAANDPGFVTVPPRHACHNVQNRGAQEMRDPSVGREERGADALHVVRHLVVEKFELAHVCKDLYVHPSMPPKHQVLILGQ